MIRLLWSWLLTSLLVSAAAAAAPPDPQVSDFVPQGTIKDVRQVTARFSAPIVALGDPRGGGDPFLIDCPEKGSGRWVDSRTWVWDFARDLPAGVRCSFSLREGLKALGGATVGGPRSFLFDTGGPAVRSTIPYGGSESIHEDQAFVLVLDAEATEASVLEHVSFAVEGLPESIGVRVLPPDETKAVLATLDEWELEGNPAIVIQARQKFPSEKQVKLTWGAGISTPSGLSTTEDQVFEFPTRPVFTAYVRCER